MTDDRLETLIAALTLEQLNGYRAALILNLQDPRLHEAPCTCLPYPEGSVCDGCRHNSRREITIAFCRGRIAALDAELYRRNPPRYLCPRCGAVSYNPRDLVEGYCGRCHAFEDPSTP